MKKELSQYHKGTNDYMYNDFLPPENTKTFTGLLVSIEWWHQKGEICPDMQLQERRRQQNIAVCIPEIYRVLRTKIEESKLQGSCPRNSMALQNQKKQYRTPYMA